MTNYRPRYVIEIDSIRGDMDSPRKVWLETGDREDAVQEVNHLDRSRNVYLTDRLAQAKRSDVFYLQGYYSADEGFGEPVARFTGNLDVLEQFLNGRIDAMADLALDRLDREAAASERRADYETSERARYREAADRNREAEDFYHRMKLIKLGASV